MVKQFIVGGCSFTFGNELSDDLDGAPSKKTWAHLLLSRPLRWQNKKD